MPPPQTRTRTRRFSACHRHPNQPVTGFCALCLKDRLSVIDSSFGQPHVAAGQPVHIRRSTSPAPVPEFRRSKSVAVEIRKDVIEFDPRRNSCDVRARNTLSDLFVVDDKRKSIKLGFSTDVSHEIRVSDDVIELNREFRVSDDVIELNREVRVSDDVIELNNEIRVLDDVIELNREVRVSDDVIELNNETRVLDDDDEVIEGELKTMKEIIDMELKNNKRSLRSVFGQKLRKWGQKQKGKKQSRCINDDNESKLGELSQDYGFGRRSCDTEPRFSIDAHRLSVEEPRFSLDEHRASWDGYMMARAIPRLTPMLSVVDNTVLSPVNRVVNAKTVENLQMHSISEDGVSSGGSGKSNSDSSSSNRGSSSSSMKSSSTKTVGFGGGDDVKSASNARVSPASDVVFQGTKLVITEKELKDWHLNSIKNNNNNVESVSNGFDSTSKTSEMNITNPSNEQKKVMSSRWRKVCSLWGHKQKPDAKNGRNKNEHIPVSRVENGNSGANHVRIPSSVNSRTRRDEFVLDRNRSTRYSTSDIDSGLLRLYLTPFRNSRRNKFGRSRAPPSMITNGLQLH